MRVRLVIGACAGAVLVAAGWQMAGTAAERSLTMLKTPDGGIQPQAAVDEKGVVHVVYLKGEPGASDVYYVRCGPGDERWSAPIRVNSRPGSAVAAGTIRGAQIAIGKGGRVHVAWNGSRQAMAPEGAGRTPARVGQHGGHSAGRHGGSPMLYTRMNDAGTAFEPERNLMQVTSLLDGGGAVAADRRGRVYVVWHAADGSASTGEQGRRVWVAVSSDEGRSFSRERAAFAEPTGACPCCGTRAFADRRGTVYILYRTASSKTDRDSYLLVSRDGGETFHGALIHPWKVPG